MSLDEFVAVLFRERKRNISSAARYLFPRSWQPDIRGKTMPARIEGTAMTDGGPSARLAVSLALWMIFACASGAPTAHAQRPAQDQTSGAELHQIPVRQAPGDSQIVMIQALVKSPSVPGVRPVAIINHGAPRDAADALRVTPNSYAAAQTWFLQRGYVVVVPVRRGYGTAAATAIREGYGSCNTPDYFGAGQATADDIAAVIEYLPTLPFADARRIVVVGQSAGGWGAIALASRNPPGVVAVINFAGGRGSPQPGQVCQPARLVDAARRFGRSARVPSLWLYSENDRYFDQPLVRTMVNAYGEGRSNTEFVALPPFGEDGHLIINRPEALGLWTQPVERFLQRVMR
jgi:dienelactone hydrolase